MANQWMESLVSLVDSSAVRSLAGQLGETPDAVKKGVEGSALAMLLSLANRAGDTGFLTTILNLLTNPAVSADALSNAGSLLGGGSALSSLATQFLGSLFAEKQSAVASAIAQSSGMKSSSAASLLSAAAPLVLAFLNKQNGSAGVAGLASALLAQKAGLRSLVPAGLDSLLSGGLPALPEGNPSAAKWILPALLAAAALFGFWYFNQPKPVEKAAQETKEVAAKAVESTSNALTAAWAALGELFARKLPNGVELNIPKLGVENRLIDFIADAAKPVDKTTWFDFDRLLFDTGKATLQPASQEQLKNVAEILKAFPAVELRIGGYTDNTGDPKFNLTLSGERANTVMGELVKLGIAPGRLSAEGYGDQHPVAPNDTEENRQKNRRVSMRVTKK